MNATMRNRIDRDPPAKNIAERGVFGVANVSLPNFSSDNLVTVGTADVSNIGLEDLDGFLT